MSQGSSLEVLADDEDDDYRLREVTEVEGELNLAMTTPAKSKELHNGSSQKLI